MASKVRLGVVGCGVIGQHHLRAATGWPGLEVVAVSDLRDEAAQKAADTFNVKTTYRDGEALIADPNIDAIVLAMPTGVRTPLALKALAAGKHVLLEKPVAMNAGEVRQMIAARNGKVVACCSSRHRFIKSASIARDFINTGALGPLRLVRCRAVTAAGKGPPPGHHPVPWRLSRALNGGGIMANWGCYDLDFLLGITGWRLEPRVVLGQAWQIPPQFSNRAAPGSDAETHVAATVRCAGDTVLSIERGETLAAQPEMAWQIIGTRGSLKLDMLPGQHNRLVHDDTTPEDGVISRTLHEGEESWQTIHEGPVRDFADAIREGRNPMTGLEQALVIQQITDAIYASAASGGAVTIH